MTSILLATVISITTLIIVIIVSKKYNLFMDNCYTDKPQNFHNNCTPRAGGFGLLNGLLIIFTKAFGLKFLIPILLAFISGIFEDFHNSLSPITRLILQFIAALFAVLLLDAVVRYLGLGIYLPYWVSIIFTIFAIVGMMNAMNMIDGFNGLASGVGLLILMSFYFVSKNLGNNDIVYIIEATLGSLIGFFILNFPKGKIFLGDGGAYLLGFMLAIIGIFLASKYEAVSPWYILSVFIYPVWEVIFSIIRKKSMGKSPLKPDSYHFHMLVYRELAKANNPLTTIYILLFLMPFIYASTMFPNNSKFNIKVTIIFIICYSIIYLLLYKKNLSRIVH